MPGIPHPIVGRIRDEDGNLIIGARVYIYNKTRDEVKNYSDTNFGLLTTNSVGEYNGNLANFDIDYEQGDILWISAYYEDKAMNARAVVSGGSNEVNLIIKDLEPSIAIQYLIQAYVIDPNTERNNMSSNVVKPNYNRSKLTKENYPRISIKDINEDSDSASAVNNQAEERTHTIQITVYCWAKPNDSQVFTINSAGHGGTKLRDYFAREVVNAIRKQFYTKPSYNKDAIIEKFYDYNRIRMESEDFDEVADAGIIKKVIEIQFKSITQS